MRQAISYEMLMMLVGPSGATRAAAPTDFAKLDFIQSYDFSFNLDRAALKQLGTGVFATRQTQFAPDVNLNFEYYLNDGWNENFIGLNMKEVDYKSFVKGFITGTAVLVGVAGTVYLINKVNK